MLTVQCSRHGEGIVTRGFDVCFVQISVVNARAGWGTGYRALRQSGQMMGGRNAARSGWSDQPDHPYEWVLSARMERHHSPEMGRLELVCDAKINCEKTLK
jgi:hypothetical protein